MRSEAVGGSGNGSGSEILSCDGMGMTLDGRLNSLNLGF
jgi:hypothetical protein